MGALTAVIIGCTILIIVCLGGGKTLGKIILWVAGLAIAAVVLMVSRTTDLPAPTPLQVMVPILLVAGFFWLFSAAVRLERRIKEGKAGSFWRWL